MSNDPRDRAAAASRSMTGASDPCAPRDRADLHVIFPPQWSPFQPFLSTPSLKAYLEDCGHRVLQSDWNVGFYHFFISHGRLAAAIRKLRRYIDELGDEHAVYRARAVHALTVLQNYRILRGFVDELRDPSIASDLPRFKRTVDAFQQLLDAFSVAEPVVEVGTSSLSTGDVLSRRETLEAFVGNESENPFLPYFKACVSELPAPRYFGVSIIGAEQVVPGLTLCRIIKERFPDVPVVIGGSVFSRLVEKDASLAPLFERYFDYVCRYEGEQPMDAFLASSDPRRERTPNLAFVEHGAIVMTSLCEPLPLDQIPTPNFDDLRLEDYLTPEVVLPLLSTRGCYWGKCAFCYHGMIYQDRYRMREPRLIAQDLATLHRRYGARHFAFNDEALPPKLFRLLPEAVPHGCYYFTGLYKFEKTFQPKDYRAMYDAGFRSLYIGLESASERVQRHMRKSNLKATMASNLQDAHDAGIWNHVFVFFGFPSESEEEAQETIDFLVEHADTAHSEGTGTFSFEHNAPIYHDPSAYGVEAVIEKPERYLELYYNYRPSTGLDASAAQKARERFDEIKRARHLYQTGRWIPREYLLILLSRHSRDGLRRQLAELEARRPPERIGDAFEWVSSGDGSARPKRYFVVGRWSRQVYETNEDAVILLSLLGKDAPTEELARACPALSCLV